MTYSNLRYTLTKEHQMNNTNIQTSHSLSPTVVFPGAKRKRSLRLELPTFRRCGQLLAIVVPFRLCGMFDDNFKSALLSLDNSLVLEVSRDLRNLKTNLLLQYTIRMGRIWPLARFRRDLYPIKALLVPHNWTQSWTSLPRSSVESRPSVTLQAWQSRQPLTPAPQHRTSSWLSFALRPAQWW